MTTKAPGRVLLEMKGIGKSFPGVKALEGVNLSIREGQVHALLGENGAGKSTLIKILSGAYKRDAGQIFVNGEEASISNPRDAKKYGIETIYQTLALAQLKKINKLSPAGGPGGFCEFAVSCQAIDSTGFSRIGATGESDFPAFIWRALGEFGRAGEIRRPAVIGGGGSGRAWSVRHW